MVRKGLCNAHLLPKSHLCPEPISQSMKDRTKRTHFLQKLHRSLPRHDVLIHLITGGLEPPDLGIIGILQNVLRYPVQQL